MFGFGSGTTNRDAGTEAHGSTPRGAGGNAAHSGALPPATKAATRGSSEALEDGATACDELRKLLKKDVLTVSTKTVGAPRCTDPTRLARPQLTAR